MEPNSPNPPKKFVRLPIYLGRCAFFLAFVPLAMTFLCIVTENSFSSLIDLYYCFVTPFQICKWSAIISLLLSFSTNIAARLIYHSDYDAYWEEYSATRWLVSRSTILVVLEIAFYLYVITFLN
ncbi:MAG: hypothetical protein IJQ39_06485 [Thermoguttaceae bacterium]|nr:hypothetical protein [Thermoguttaceae bacterium]